MTVTNLVADAIFKNANNYSEYSSSSPFMRDLAQLLISMAIRDQNLSQICRVKVFNAPERCYLQIEGRLPLNMGDTVRRIVNHLLDWNTESLSMLAKYSFCPKIQTFLSVSSNNGQTEFKDAKVVFKVVDELSLDFFRTIMDKYSTPDCYMSVEDSKVYIMGKVAKVDATINAIKNLVGDGLIKTSSRL